MLYSEDLYASRKLETLGKKREDNDETGLLTEVRLRLEVLKRLTALEIFSIIQLTLSETLVPA